MVSTYDSSTVMAGGWAMSDKQQGTLSYTRTDSIAVPQSTTEQRFAIRKLDWDRVKRNMAKCKSDASTNLSGWYFTCFGIAASALLSIYPFSMATGISPWVIPAYWCAAGSFTIIGIVLLLLDWRLKREKRERLDELELDMKEIEQGFGPMS